MLSWHVGLAPLSEGGIRWGGRESWCRQLSTFFEGSLAWFFWNMHQMQRQKTTFAFRAISMCYQKLCLLLPEAVFAACINSHYILSPYFFYASCRHQLTEPLKEQMYWRNASICVWCFFFLLQFGGVCPMGFLAKGLYVSQEKFTFMRGENWGKSLLLDPEVRDAGLLSFYTCEGKAHSYRNSCVSTHLSFFPSVKNYKRNQIFLCQ